MYKLSSAQREILEALVKLYDKHRRLVKSKEIAELVGKDEGTVRNIIAGLKSLGLVESKTGPSGGYMPTLKAYEVLRGFAATEVPVPVRKDGQLLNLVVTSVELIDVLNPEGIRAILRVQGDIEGLEPGDRIKIGPMPYTRLVIEGIVVYIDRYTKQVSVNVRRVTSIPRESVGSIASKQLITLKPNMSIREAAKILSEKMIRGAPVIDDEGRLIGIITLADIAKAVAEGRLDAKVEEYMSKEVVTVREDQDILDAIRLMQKYRIGRLVVLDAMGKLKGIVTRTDILRFISALED
ncbi:putative signal transduction protein with CBS domains [Pyrolobus fumarii 1A]|uniref:Putative signal transduction protein with CBS domains n=1 Tax=Pyrolobus fumarii (strain DSM 11204 / 1A) TaxID=694429 RepID=G0EH73_PYRF1|nr:putative signal transduction protein with CBS domains [Pyrolobus fumarii 1A]